MKTSADTAAAPVRFRIRTRVQFVVRLPSCFSCRTTRTRLLIATLAMCLLPASTLSAADVERRRVEGQPLAANASRLLDALQYLGAPYPA
ncbi:MAG: hypothetical protein KDA89_10005, partial [Planctomycetaceae bacterium]|nr:hypothetical protein [Planctomycetaceae bacterium]